MCPKYAEKVVKTQDYFSYNAEFTGAVSLRVLVY